MLSEAAQHNPEGRSRSCPCFSKTLCKLHQSTVYRHLEDGFQQAVLCPVDAVQLKLWRHGAATACQDTRQPQAHSRDCHCSPLGDWRLSGLCCPISSALHSGEEQVQWITMLCHCMHSEQAMLICQSNRSILFTKRGGPCLAVLPGRQIQPTCSIACSPPIHPWAAPEPVAVQQWPD